ncbi:MAG: anhydro-N-acetylmuramic acid kinase [Rhodomicrobium sp.]
MKAIGLMSGTSMDGIDVALIETDGEAIHSVGPACAFPYTAPERHLLNEAMVSARGVKVREDRSGVLALAESMLTSKHAESVRAFAGMYGIALSSVGVVGFHGQTVLHRPERWLTVQLGDGQGLSAALGVPVVYDFRAADMECGGQGAPLVPIFHRAHALHGRLPLPAAFVNIGGISNITFVPEGPAEGLIAFDAGPGNCLIDDWALRHTGEPLDRDAHLALSGHPSREVLAALLAHPYFKAPAPKSLDRGTFTLDMIEGLSPADGAATLTAFTVAGIAAAARLLPAQPQIWVIAGGGTHNPHILQGLRRVLGAQTLTADAAGFSADFMEAQAFAYLAVRRLKELPSTFAGTTGVSSPVVAGVIAYPGDAPHDPVGAAIFGG